MSIFSQYFTTIYKVTVSSLNILHAPLHHWLVTLAGFLELELLDQ